MEDLLGAESWAELGYWGRAGVLGAVTAVLLGAGWRLRTGDGRVPPRLAGVLWLGAVAAFAGLLAVLLGGRSDDAVDDPTLAVAGGALVLAGGLYLVERRCCSRWRCSGPRWPPSWPPAAASRSPGPASRGPGWPCSGPCGWSWDGGGWWCRGGPRRRWAGLPWCRGARPWPRWDGHPPGSGWAAGGWGSGRGRGRVLAQAAGRYWQDLGAPLAILLFRLGLVAVALARLRPARGDCLPR